ncbi:ABC transporter substrate-binding protein [Pseudohoeflea coraliihabitans]|uniref:ABC transporter substrate-binding protein n=1 Tax=Pseudohoeflea coraliihabitans TaxID=2860393 RepID=A0ABS6WS89_9HYPH|nr:ABC transporter substrate-binding protein [Pseudohoeflea sp. DP4N28-3]
MKTTVRTVTAALFAAALISQAAFAETKAGLLLPKSGNYAALGEEIDAGVVLALEEAGMADDIRLVREDSEAKPPVGLAKTRKLVLQDNVDVLIGIVSSAVLGAVRNFVDGAGVPLIVANAGNVDATGKDCSASIFRVSFSNAQLNRPMGTWMAGQGIGKVYTLAPDYAAGHQMIEAFISAFEAAGGEVIGSEFTPFGKTQDFGPWLSKVGASEADALYVFYAGGEANSFLSQYRAFGMGETVPLYGPGFITSPLQTAAQGEAAVGIRSALHYIPSLDTPENNSFIAAFTARFKRQPSEYAVQGYDAARVLIEAIRVGASGRAEIAAALPGVRYTGPRGPLQIDPATHNIIQNIYIYETVMSDEGITQKLLDTVENVRDAANGCDLR